MSKHLQPHALFLDVQQTIRVRHMKLASDHVSVKDLRSMLLCRHAPAKTANPSHKIFCHECTFRDGVDDATGGSFELLQGPKNNVGKKVKDRL